MKMSMLSRLALASIVAGGCAVPVDGQAFWKKLFGDPLEEVPSVDELQSQEAAASALLEQGRSEEAAGSAGAAEKAYKRAVSRYPLTRSAAEAQFRIAKLLEGEGKISSAFDAYDEFIRAYKQSPRFSEALQAQFEIANAAKDGAKVKRLGIPFKFDTSRTVQMFEGVIANAPRSPLAPQAQLAIGQVYEAEGSTAQAVAAYLKVAEDFPESPQAAEAQLAIANVNVDEAEGTFDSGRLTAAQEALDDYTLLRDAPEPDPLIDEQRGVLDELGAEQAYKIARFYEKRGNPTAAAVYYADVTQVPTSAFYAESRERLAQIAATDPEAVKALGSSADPDQNPLVVQAESDVSGRPDYLGPPTPALRRLARAPQMRASPDAPLFPIDEPPLPGEEPPVDLSAPLNDADLLLPGIEQPTDLSEPAPPDPTEPLPLPERPSAPPTPEPEPETPTEPAEGGSGGASGEDGTP
jgi:outer membrane protein assembly factor BamD (BamD/ComL family)